MRRFPLKSFLLLCLPIFLLVGTGVFFGVGEKARLKFAGQFLRVQGMDDASPIGEDAFFEADASAGFRIEVPRFLPEAKNFTDRTEVWAFDGTKRRLVYRNESGSDYAPHETGLRRRLAFYAGCAGWGKRSVAGRFRLHLSDVPQSWGQLKLHYQLRLLDGNKHPFAQWEKVLPLRPHNGKLRFQKPSRAANFELISIERRDSTDEHHLEILFSTRPPFPDFSISPSKILVHPDLTHLERVHRDRAFF